MNDFDNVGSEEQAAKKLYAALPATQPEGIRPMEVIWILITLWLFCAYLELTDVSPKVIQERIPQAECQRLKDVAEQRTTLVVGALNGNDLLINGSRVAACKRVSG